MDLQLGTSRLLLFGCYIPGNPLQVQNKNRIEDRDQEQGDEGSDGESTDLRITERFPEWPTLECEREQSKDRRADGDHHRPDTLNPGIRKSSLQGLALFVHLLDEVEQYDHMADDDPDETGNPKKCHESEGRTHDRQSDQRSDRSVRRGRKHKQRLDGILELHKQSQVDADKRDKQNDGEIHEPIVLLCFLASNLHLIS